MVILLITLIIVLNLSCLAMMLLKLQKEPVEQLPFSQRIKIMFCGFLAFVADTIGIGSFPANISLARITGIFKDDEMRGVNNGAQILPGMIESFFFLYFFEVDMNTLAVLVLGTCVGALIGGKIFKNLTKQTLRLTMLIFIFFFILLLTAHKFLLFPIGGYLIELQSWPLYCGFFAMALCGALTSIGIGLFVMVQAVLFLLNISPLAAFPIMTTAGAVQQPLTTMIYLKNHHIALRKTFLLSLSGCLGVLIILPLFRNLTMSWLHALLLVILIYNFFGVGRAYLKTKKLSKKNLSCSCFGS